MVPDEWPPPGSPGDRIQLTFTDDTERTAEETPPGGLGSSDVVAQFVSSRDFSVTGRSMSSPLWRTELDDITGLVLHQLLHEHAAVVEIDVVPFQQHIAFGHACCGSGRSFADPIDEDAGLKVAGVAGHDAQTDAGSASTSPARRIGLLEGQHFIASEHLVGEITGQSNDSSRAFGVDRPRVIAGGVVVIVFAAEEEQDRDVPTVEVAVIEGPIPLGVALMIRPVGATTRGSISSNSVAVPVPETETRLSRSRPIMSMLSMAVIDSGSIGQLSRKYSEPWRPASSASNPMKTMERRSPSPSSFRASRLAS